MKPTRRRIIEFLILLFAALTAPSSQAADNAVTTSMVGHWQGSARIIVNWCKQPLLPVEIEIHSDGSVTGKVGDARLTKAQLTRNRGWVGRKLNLASDYIIRGYLKGPVVAAEGITRSSVAMPIDFSSGRFVGGVHTSGSKFGGQANMILSASSLNLHKQ